MHLYIKYSLSTHGNKPCILRYHVRVAVSCVRTFVSASVCVSCVCMCVYYISISMYIQETQ